MAGAYQMDLDLLESGATRLSYSSDELQARLREAMQDPMRLASAETVLDWISGSISDGMPGPIEATEGHPASDTRIDRWSPPSSATPQYMPPIRLGFELPATGNMPPVEELTPWWSQIVLTPTPQDPPIATHAGARMNYGSFSGTNWGLSPFREHQTGSEIRLYGDHIEAQSWWASSTPRIKEAGTLGSLLIPGYGDVRDLVSNVSETMTRGSHGCRLALNWISSVSLSMIHVTNLPLSPKDRTIAKRRGFGFLKVGRISLEFSDGWAPQRVCLEIDDLHCGQEGAFESFAGSILRQVASSRHTDALNSADRQTVESLSASSPPIDQVVDGKHVVRSRKAAIPGACPVSADLSTLERT